MDNKINLSEILHPEMLTKEKLITVLKDWSVILESKEGLDKPSLVKLYHETVQPLPQRTYRNNRRGKLMKKLQKGSLSLKDKEDQSSVPNKTNNTCIIQNGIKRKTSLTENEIVSSNKNIKITGRKRLRETESEKLKNSLSESDKLPNKLQTIKKRKSITWP